MGFELKFCREASKMSLIRRRQTNQITENSAAGGEITVDDQTEELGEATMATLTEIAENEREGKMESVASENGERIENLVQDSGGYRRDRPPEDDCCPICHGDFHIPCRTSCGHWFCGDCVLQIWKYANFRQCVCPICGSLIFNLVPHSSALIQPGEEDSIILREIKRYSSQNMVGWFGIFKKALVPRFTYERFYHVLLSLRIGVMLLRLDLLLYQIYGFRLFSKGVQMLVYICTFAMLILVIRKRWKRLRRERQMAEQNVIR